MSLDLGIQIRRSPVEAHIVYTSIRVHFQYCGFRTQRFMITCTEPLPLDIFTFITKFASHIFKTLSTTLQVWNNDWKTISAEVGSILILGWIPNETTKQNLERWTSFSRNSDCHILLYTYNAFLSNFLALSKTFYSDLNHPKRNSY